MAPPPPSSHASWQSLHDFAQHHASQHGYALSINTTSKTRARIKLACVCYGAPKNTHKLTPATRVRRNRASYKTGCRMWLEGRRQDDGTWVLRVGEPEHNHPGRAREEWATQRRRTWGVAGGCMGVGGVAAREEMRRLVGRGGDGDAGVGVEGDGGGGGGVGGVADRHSLAHGSLVWQIVEREMGRTDALNQGRDRGVGRTVAVLEEELPGIRIFKRDVYNIRAKIKRMRKSGVVRRGGGSRGGGDEDGDGNDGDDGDGDVDADADDDDHVDEPADTDPPEPAPTLEQRALDPLLLAQPTPTPEQRELAQLRRENAELRELLRESQSENQRLKLRLDYVHGDVVQTL